MFKFVTICAYLSLMLFTQAPQYDLLIRVEVSSTALVALLTPPTLPSKTIAS
jgi:hypothetical protein